MNSLNLWSTFFAVETGGVKLDVTDDGKPIDDGGDITDKITVFRLFGKDWDSHQRSVMFSILHKRLLEHIRGVRGSDTAVHKIIQLVNEMIHTAEIGDIDTMMEIDLKRIALDLHAPSLDINEIDRSFLASRTYDNFRYIIKRWVMEVM